MCVSTFGGLHAWYVPPANFWWLACMVCAPCQLLVACMHMGMCPPVPHALRALGPASTTCTHYVLLDLQAVSKVTQALVQKLHTVTHAADSQGSISCFHCEFHGHMCWPLQVQILQFLSANRAPCLTLMPQSPVLLHKRGDRCDSVWVGLCNCMRACVWLKVQAHALC